MAGYKTIKVSSQRDVEMIDITAAVQRFLKEEKCHTGILVVYTPHTTAGITINENADPAVRHDIEQFLSRSIPHESYFRHGEGNSPAHIMSSLVSASEILIVENGCPLLGTWQGVYFCEFDGPRQRQVHFKFVPG